MTIVTATPRLKSAHPAFLLTFEYITQAETPKRTAYRWIGTSSAVNSYCLDNSAQSCSKTADLSTNKHDSLVGREQREIICFTPNTHIGPFPKYFVKVQEKHKHIGWQYAVETVEIEINPAAKADPPLCIDLGHEQS